MNQPESRIRRLVHHDTVDTYEKITKKHYGENTQEENREMLGLFLRNNEAKKHVLKSSKDTYFSMPLEEYEEVLLSNNFEIAATEKFDSKFERPDKWVIWWNPLGILLFYDTYWGQKSINGGKFYYNVKGKLPCDVISSGTYELHNNDYVWVGDHDCREATLFHIRELQKHGEFITPWLYQPSLWLFSYNEKPPTENWTEKLDYYDENRMKKIALLPEHIRKQITP